MTSRAQVTLLCKYWDKHENGWWTQRRHSNLEKFASGGSLDEKVVKPSSKSKKKGKKQAKEEEKEKAVEKSYIKISDTTKMRIVMEDLIVRKRAYRAKLADYNVEYAKWSAEYKVLPPVQDMYQLIEKGFLGKD
ncbi:hypothetical protein HDU96_001675 [Phlyctochytrium bullatum]|nr:hypothetical protein HDU96_001675 [Phlyctochytrium bullatum]